MIFGCNSLMPIRCILTCNDVLGKSSTPTRSHHCSDESQAGHSPPCLTELQKIDRHSREGSDSEGALKPCEAASSTRNAIDKASVYTKRQLDSTHLRH